MAKVKYGHIHEAFTSEKHCREYLASVRRESRFVRPQCGGRHQTSVTAGTLLRKSHVPPTKWFLAFYFVCQDKRASDIVPDQSDLQDSVAYAGPHPHRCGVTGKQAGGTVELDDTYFSGPTRDKKCAPKRRVSQLHTCAGGIHPRAQAV